MKKTLVFYGCLLVLALGITGCGEKTYDVELTEAGETKIKMIRVIQEETGLELNDAKSIVDNAPAIVIENVTKEEAENMKEKLETGGGTVTIVESE